MSVLIEVQSMLPVFTTLATVMIAVQATRIASRQALTSEDKLRLDLYDRRLVCYQRSVAYYRCLQSGKDEQEVSDAYRIFNDAKLEVPFLFPDASGIFELLNQMDSNAFQWVMAKEDRTVSFINPPVAPKSSLRKIQASEDFSKAIAELQDKLKPYLSFDIVHNGRGPSRIRRFSTQ
jgi:hypothetical protein